MTSYVLNFLSPHAPTPRGYTPRRATERSAARRTPHVAPRRRNVTTQSALLTGMLWRGTLIDHGALIGRGVLPFFEPDRRATSPSGLPWSGFDPHRVWPAIRAFGGKLLARLRGH